MAIQSKQNLIDYVKRRLGSGVVEINVSDDQVSDRIDDALQKYASYHYDGIERFYLKHTLTQSDIDNKYIPVNDPIVGVNRVMPVGKNSTNMFDLSYQMRLNDIHNLASNQLVSYYMAESHLNTIDYILGNEIIFEFRKHTDKLHLIIDWDNDVSVDDHIIVECYKKLDPESNLGIYNDSWLKSYSTSLVKKQWGQNLSKFEGMTLPGGLTYNGRSILDEAEREIEQLEESVRSTYESPPQFYIG